MTARQRARKRRYNAWYWHAFCRTPRPARARYRGDLIALPGTGLYAVRWG